MRRSREIPGTACIPPASSSFVSVSRARAGEGGERGLGVEQGDHIRSTRPVGPASSAGAPASVIASGIERLLAWAPDCYLPTTRYYSNASRGTRKSMVR